MIKIHHLTQGIVNGNIHAFIYSGICDGTPTVWITRSEWDLKITVQYINNEITYKDSKGQKMLIFDPEDDKFIDFYHSLNNLNK